MENDETEDKGGARVNLRMSDSQFELMMRLAGALGIEKPGQAARHFFLLGMQSSMGALSGSANTKAEAFMQFMMQQMAAEQPAQVEQLDLVKEASKKAS